MNLTKQELQPLQFVLRPRKTMVDLKKQEEQLVVGKKPSFKIFESKQNPKPIEDNNWADSVKPPRSSMNPMHLVPNPSENKEDLEIKKATVLMKNLKSPFKNEYIENQISGGEEVTAQRQSELEQQFKSDNLKKEFAEFLKWQNQQKLLRRNATQQDFHINNSNITNQEHITQIAKCLILTHHNSPSNLKHKKVITLGRSGEDFLRVTKYRDQLYFENKVQRDKVNQNWNEFSFDESSNMQMRGTQSLKFSRLSKGLVDQYKPDLKCVYPLKIVYDKNKRLDVSVKRMNRKKVNYLNQIYAKHMMNYLYQENQQQQHQTDQNGDQQSDIGFDDLQNGIYVTALQQQQQQQQQYL